MWITDGSLSPTHSCWEWSKFSWVCTLVTVLYSHTGGDTVNILTMDQYVSHLHPEGNKAETEVLSELSTHNTHVGFPSVTQYTLSRNSYCRWLIVSRWKHMIQDLSFKYTLLTPEGSCFASLRLLSAQKERKEQQPEKIHTNTNIK